VTPQDHIQFSTPNTLGTLGVSFALDGDGSRLAVGVPEESKNTRRMKIDGNKVNSKVSDTGKTRNSVLSPITVGAVFIYEC
jgi:hypothetical protein